MRRAILRRRLTLPTALIGLIAAFSLAPAAADAPPAASILLPPPIDAVSFLNGAPLDLPPVYEPWPGADAPTGDDPGDDDDDPSDAMSLWLFGLAAMILPVSGLGAGLRRRGARRPAAS